MVLSVLFGRKYPKTKVGTIEFDTSISEEHIYQARVTSFPVEGSGTGASNVSDHIYNSPTRVNISGIVSDTPINIFAARDRSVSVFNRLVEIHRKKELVTLVSGIKTYPNMALVSLVVPRDIKTGQSLTFNMEFQEVVYSNQIAITTTPINVLNVTQESIQRDQVADNGLYPAAISSDPVDSLKDQSSSSINLGLQSLKNIPAASQPNVIANAAIINGVIL